MTTPGTLVELDEEYTGSVASNAQSSLVNDRLIVIANILPMRYDWIHDYHLLALPYFLHRRFNRLCIGFFLHSSFPSSELYRSLPARDEILKSLLNCDLIGFHTFYYARHFLTYCNRMLGIEYQSKRGYIGLDYFGRTVGIKIMHVGINMVQLQSQFRLPDLEWRVTDLRKKFDGKIVMLGVDDMDIFKVINLKILAFEQMLKTHLKWQGQAVLVQIASPKGGSGKDLEEIQAEIDEKQLLHEKHYRYVSTHDVAYCSKSYIHDLERSCSDHFRRRCCGIGLGFGFRVVALDRNFKKLTVDSIVADYKRR